MNSITEMLMIGGIFFIISGLILKWKPPKKINWIYGYRTSTSMRNQETWNAANRYSAKLMILIGIIIVFSGFIASALHSVNEMSRTYGILYIVFASIILIVLTEIHLKKTFNKDGMRKNNFEISTKHIQ